MLIVANGNSERVDRRKRRIMKYASVKGKRRGSAPLIARRVSIKEGAGDATCLEAILSLGHVV